MTAGAILIFFAFILSFALGTCNSLVSLSNTVKTAFAQVDDGSGQIGILAESYPGLKAQKLFAELSKQLKDTEDRIALAREYFNSIANHYNLRLGIFPDGIVASLFGLRPFNNR